MASSTHLNMILFVIGICFIILENVASEGNNQLPSDSAIERRDSSFFFYQNSDYPRDCSEVRDSCTSSVTSGVYLIKPDGYADPFEVYCDNETDSGGWTVIFRRLDGSVKFKRNWGDYKEGFGFLSTEFWLGNDKLSFLTNQAVYELQIDITMENGTSCDLQYNAFRISDEWSDYTLTSVGTYESDEACKWKEGRECGTPEECNPIEDTTSFTDCNDVYDAGETQDGIYSIRPAGWSGSPFNVFCKMSIDGGNWTVFQRRVDGSTDFYRNWTEYREGFGDLQHEFWLGNEKLYYLTQQGAYEYRIDFVKSSDTSHYNKYSSFRINDETNKYRVTELGSRTGSSGYSLYQIQNIAFSTYDQDNDGQSYNCAEGHQSGWWHGGLFYTGTSSYCYYFPSGNRHVRCSYANPNGDYDGGNGENIYDSYSSPYCNQKYTEMKIRRIS